MNIVSKLPAYLFDKDNNCVSLHINEFNNDHHPSVLNVMNKHCNSRMLYKYNSDYDVHNELLMRLSNYTRVDVNNLILTNGADIAIQLLINSFTDNKGVVFNISPSYRQYKRFAKLQNTKTVDLLSITNLFDYDSVLSSNKRSIVFICSPNNPTGEEYSIDQITYLLDRYPNVLFCIDFTYIDYSQLRGDYDIENNKKLLQYKNVACIRSFSKAFGLAGMRLGYIISCKENVEQLNCVFNFKNVITLTKLLGIEILKNISWYKNKVLEMDNIKNNLTNTLDSLFIKWKDTSCNFIIVDFGRELIPICEYLKKNNILIRNIDSSIKNHARISIGRLREINILKQYLINYYIPRQTSAL